MTIPVEIEGVADTGDIVQVKMVNRNMTPGLVAYTDDLRQWIQRSILFVSEDGSRDMNVDGSFGGTQIDVHDGTDNAFWTATATVGTWDVASTNQANTTYGGTKSIEALNMADGDTLTISKGSDQTFVGYTTLTGWVYITRFNAAFQEIMISWQNDSVLVGNSINMIDYIDSGLLNTWQQYAIPKGDFGLNGSTIDEVLITFTSSGGSAPRVYFDDIRIEETGGLQYTARPAAGKIVEYQRLELLFADAFAGTVTNGTMKGLDYSQLLGLGTLTVGFALQRFDAGAPQISLSLKSFADLESFTFDVGDGMSNGTNTMVKVVGNLPVPVRLDSTKGDKIVITINDDMSGLLLFRAILVGKELVNG